MNYYYSEKCVSARATNININIPKASDVDPDLYFRQILFENLPVTGNGTWLPHNDTHTHYEEWKSISHGKGADGVTPLTVADVAWKLLKKKHDTIIDDRFGFQFDVDNSMMPILVLREKNFWPIILQIKCTSVTTQDIDDFVSVLEFNLAQIRLCLQGWNEAVLGAWPTAEPSTVKIFGFVFGKEPTDDFTNGKYGTYPRFVVHEDNADILLTGNNGTVGGKKGLGAERSPWNLISGSSTVLNVNSLNFWSDPDINLLTLQSNPNDPIDEAYASLGTFVNTSRCHTDHPAMGNEAFFVTKVHTDKESGDAMYAARHYIYIGGFDALTRGSNKWEDAKSIILHEMMHTLLGVYDTYKIGNCSNLPAAEQDSCENDPYKRDLVGWTDPNCEHNPGCDYLPELYRGGDEWFATFPATKTILHFGDSLTAFDVAYIRMQYKRQIDFYSQLSARRTNSVSSAYSQTQGSHTHSNNNTEPPPEEVNEQQAGDDDYVLFVTIALLIVISAIVFVIWMVRRDPTTSSTHSDSD